MQDSAQKSRPQRYEEDLYLSIPISRYIVDETSTILLYLSFTFNMENVADDSECKKINPHFLAIYPFAHPVNYACL
jgi:hypothetical protein